MQRRTVLLLFGGESSEHEVSISSARNVYAAMDDTKYDVVLSFIDRHGKWWLLEELGMTIDTNRAVQLVAAMGGRSFITIPGNRVISPDVILPILHGKNGEDGSVQGLAQLMHLPIVGCDMTSSVLAMDKISSKEIFQSQGFTVLPYTSYRHGETIPSYDELTGRFGSVLFVKPPKAGSSVGVSRVTNQSELDVAVEEAYRHDEFIVIEQAAKDPRELEVAVLGTPPHHEASGVGEIRPDGEFYSYDSKYSSDSTSDLIIPAELNEGLTEEIRQQALKAYAALKCKGMARVDFFLSEGKIYLNEVNTIPGFTNISMYPKLWRQAGLGYPELIDKLISLALARS